MSDEQSQSFFGKIKEKGLGLSQGAWDRFFEFSAPTTRNFDVAYVPLQRLDDDLKVDVGSFIPEYHAMAEAGMLPKQIKAQKFFDKMEADAEKVTDAEKVASLKERKPGIYKSLYHADADGSSRLKSPVELSMISYYEHTQIQRVLSNTYSWLKNNGYPWPHPISKIRVQEDYLKNLSGKLNDAKVFVPTSLIIKNDEDSNDRPTSGIKSVGIQSVYLSIKNGHKQATFREKVMHGVGPWLAWLVTLTATLSVLGIASWTMLAAAGVGTYIAVNCANQFDMFDKAESFYRDIGWIMSEKYPTVGKLSRSNFVKTAIKAAALSFVALSAGMAAGSALLGLPFLQWAPAVEIGLAIFFGTLAAVGSFAGLSGAIRYIDGFSICENQIDFNADEVKGLKVIHKEEMNNEDAMSILKKCIKSTLEPGELISVSDWLTSPAAKTFLTQADEMLVVGKAQEASNELHDTTDLSASSKLKIQ